jgi:hypothetical protein
MLTYRTYFFFGRYLIITRNVKVYVPGYVRLLPRGRPGLTEVCGENVKNCFIVCYIILCTVLVLLRQVIATLRGCAGFRREVDEIALCWDVTQRIVVIPYRRLGTTYRSHLQGSRNP